MNPIRSLLAILATLLLTVGFGSSNVAAQATTSQASSEAVVVFYRQADDGGGEYQVTMRNVALVALKSGNYATFRLQPGQHYVMADPKSEQVFPLAVEAGKTYYVRALAGARASFISSKKPVLQLTDAMQFDTEKAKLADVSPAASASTQASR